MQDDDSTIANAPHRGVAALIVSLVALVLSSFAIIRQMNQNALVPAFEDPASHPNQPAQTSSQAAAALVDSKLDALREQLLRAMDFRESQDESAELDFGGRMSSVRSESLGLLVSRKDCVPYLDGQKVTLEIGNPHFVTLSEIEMELTYGPREPAASDAGESSEDAIDSWIAWNRGLKKHKQQVPVDLKPGTWTRVEVIIAPAAQSEVAYLRINRIQFDRASLYPAAPEK